MATIDTLPPADLTSTSATLQFAVIDDGNSEGNESWIANLGYKIHSASDWIWLEDISGSGEGVFQQNLTELLPNTQYDLISRITNSAGRSYGDIEQFRVEVRPVSPSITTLPAQNITHKSGDLMLLLLEDGDPSAAGLAETRFIYWNGEQEKTTDWFTAREDQQSSAKINGLDPNTVYYFYAQARNSAGQVNGSTLSFRTYPDPNAPPAAFNTNEPNTLLIQNFVKALQSEPDKPHNNQGILTYTEKTGTLAALDANDILYSASPGTLKASKIITLLTNRNAEGAVSGFYELAKDARPVKTDPNDPNSLIFLRLSIYSVNASSDNDTTSENTLKFWLANDTNPAALNSSFNGKPLTIQQISSDPNEPNLVYPVWDIRRIIDKNGRQLPLNKLNSQKSNIPYAFFELSTTRQLLDINEDNKIDSNDYSLLLKDIGKTGIFRSDIAGAKGPGLPDGKVNVTDETAFIIEYNKIHPENPILNPYSEFSEDFESGNIQEPFMSSGDKPWIIDTSPCSGTYCVKSGNIGDNQISVLEAKIEASSGKIGFRNKVSCESEYDNLIFYIDNTETGRWSGVRDWIQTDFQTTPGTHNLKWVYSKDNSASEGEDAVWIDDIVIH